MPTFSSSEQTAPDKYIQEQGFHGAHLLDVHQLHDANLQTTADGKTILIPQSSTDPHDPLNWSSLKKHTSLAVITVAAFLADFGSSMGIITLLPQSEYVSPALSNRPNPSNEALKV